MKVKVKILGNISNYLYEGKVYKPGDIVEIDEAQYAPYIMRKIEEPIMKTEHPSEPTVVEETESAVEESIREPEQPVVAVEPEPAKPKKGPKRKKD